MILAGIEPSLQIELSLDFDQRPLPPLPVKLPAKDPLPRAKVEMAVGQRNDHGFAWRLII
jgi:hypothetical protein